ncbi:RagB/SusD family nutrient uptake outer membrane protein [Reichenbachiella ulvae]|uniref:RagB/SusD family nutrient uptake outer membrane protein n=1 Tax=Reichenbachiella ulvae TaxID=2980104 RepID=A0ABT3CUV9_9BACT|nr:RagB/SusD family nutrient uptake outer membrane protein [Reichenbachiella ulvae]MCV9387404.1 RagB/SusD family nutrient uptake outer membrane protein [Reichenbachiella ulvae]
MKLKIYIVAMLGIVFSACQDDLLTKLPETVVSSGDFYKTAEDFQQATVGMYAPLRELYGTGLGNDDFGDWTIDEMRSDNTCFIYNFNRGFAGIEQYDQFIDDANGAGAGNKYNNDYIIIGRANQILDKIDGADIDEAAKNNFKGQALFMRAFAYFDLIQHFGAVPLILNPPTSYEETGSPRVSTEEIYAEILADVELAATLLPDRASQAVGFVSNGAAYTLLGNMHLVREEWAAAEDALMQVSGYALMDDYASIFFPSNKNNTESIFEIQYWEDQSAGLASNFAYQFLPSLSNIGVVPGFPNGYANGAGGWNIPTPDLLAAYEPGDLRLDASVGYITADTYVNTPYIKKFVHGSNIAPNTNNNWPVYRYAEVLLMIAEAKNEQGEADALTYLNMVHAHSRTGLAPIAAASQAQLRDLIMQERRIELAFENKRWLDLVRTDQAVAVMNAHGAEILADPQAYYYPVGVEPPAGAYQVTTEDLLLPIPQREIRINPEIGQEDQNPGY